MNQQKFRKLKVWQKAISFIGEIYNLTNRFPKEEMFGLTTQLRKAAVSIALNIAEGSGAGSDNEFKLFLNFSLRSSYEVMSGIEIAKALRYWDDTKTEDLLKKCDELAAMLNGLKVNLRSYHSPAEC